MKIQLATRTMRARRPGTCPLCLGAILVGQYIGKVGYWAHVSCIVRNITEGNRS